MKRWSYDKPKRLNRAAVIWASMVLLVAPSSSFAQNPATEIPVAVTRAYEQVVSVQSVRGDDILSHGSGFFVQIGGQKNVVATNRHVIDRLDAGVEEIVVVRAVGDKAEEYVVSGVLADLKKYDLVLLEVDLGEAPSTIEPLTISAQLTEVGWNDELFVLSDPFMYEEQAIYAARVDDLGIIAGYGPFMTIDGQIISGQSGGPVVDHNGEVVAIVFMGVDIDEKDLDEYSELTDKIFKTDDKEQCESIQFRLSQLERCMFVNPVIAGQHLQKLIQLAKGSKARPLLTWWKESTQWLSSAESVVATIIPSFFGAQLHPDHRREILDRALRLRPKSSDARFFSVFDAMMAYQFEAADSLPRIPGLEKEPAIGGRAAQKVYRSAVKLKGELAVLDGLEGAAPTHSYYLNFFRGTILLDIAIAKIWKGVTATEELKQAVKTLSKGLDEDKDIEESYRFILAQAHLWSKEPQKAEPHIAWVRKFCAEEPQRPYCPSWLADIDELQQHWTLKKQ